MKGRDRLAVLVLAGTVALAGSAPAAAGIVRTSRRPARTEARELGIVPATLSFFNRLVEKAIAVVSPTPTPAGPEPPSTPQGGTGGSGDNGPGIDPNGL